MRLVFMGTPQAAVPSLERCLRDGYDVAAVYTQPDRPAGRGNRLAHSPIKQFALAAGIEVRQPEKIRTQASIEAFRSLNADLAVVVAYGRILPSAYLQAFEYGAVNVHFSLLPKYRGAAPVNWCIANGEALTGVTTMKMDEGLDTGEILLQRETAIGVEENAIELMERLSHLGAALLSETLEQIKTIHPRPQDDASATFAPILRRSDGLIDWNMQAKQISDRVRGFQPFPTSYTYMNGSKLTIWKAAPTGGADADAGQVIAAHGNSFTVQCGDGTGLSIIEVQPEGKRRMGSRDLLNGTRLGVGAVLGK